MGDWGTASPTWHSMTCSVLGIPVIKDRVCTSMVRPALEEGTQLPWPGSLGPIHPLESKPWKRRPACWDWQVLGRPDVGDGALINCGRGTQLPQSDSLGPVWPCKGQPWKSGVQFPQPGPLGIPQACGGQLLNMQKQFSQPSYPRVVQTCRGHPWKRGHNFPRLAP